MLDMESFASDGVTGLSMMDYKIDKHNKYVQHEVHY